ncbi:hypothetical protein [Bradyrhizobium sp. JR3.5]
MPLYHSTIFSADYPGTAFKAVAPAWQYEKANGVFRGTGEELHAENERIRLERGHAPSQAYYGDGHPVFFDMEIMIRATTTQRARQAVTLLCSAIDVLHGSAMGYFDPMEDIQIRLSGAKQDTPSFFSTSGITAACRFAALVSRASLSYAMHKLAYSYRSAGAHHMDMHPRYSPHEFRVQKEPLAHVHIANAVTLAYSAIEEMQLELRASRENPSRLKDGSWNPVVLNELKQRLRKATIDIDDPFVWTVRGPKTRIERSRQIPFIDKAKWAYGLVRDREVSIVDALAYASWLRSTTTTHRFTKTSASLTVCDAYNVQLLARRLLMERFGFWNTPTRP